MKSGKCALAIGFAIGLMTLPAFARPAAAADNFDIQVIMPLTGHGSFLGKGERQSLQLAEKVVNENGGIAGRPVHFVFHDDQGSPQVAVQLTNEVMAHHPAAILGSSLVAMCSAMSPIVQQNGPVQ